MMIARDGFAIDTEIFFSVRGYAGPSRRRS